MSQPEISPLGTGPIEPSGKRWVELDDGSSGRIVESEDPAGHSYSLLKTDANGIKQWSVVLCKCTFEIECRIERIPQGRGMLVRAFLPDCDAWPELQRVDEPWPSLLLVPGSPYAREYALDPENGMGSRQYGPLDRFTIFVGRDGSIVKRPDFLANGWFNKAIGVTRVWDKVLRLKTHPSFRPSEPALKGMLALSDDTSFFLEIDKEGHDLFHLTVDCKEIAEISYVLPLRDGGLIILGHANGALSLNGRVIFKDLDGTGYLFLIALSKKREVLWRRFIVNVDTSSDGTYVCDLQTDESIVILASTPSKFKFSGGDGTDSQVIRTKGIGAVVVDRHGALKWSGGLGSGSADPNRVAALDDGLIYVVCTTGGRWYPSEDSGQKVARQSKCSALYKIPFAAN